MATLLMLLWENVHMLERLQRQIVHVPKCSRDETSVPKWLLPKCSVPKWSIGSITLSDIVHSSNKILIKNNKATKQKQNKCICRQSCKKQLIWKVGVSKEFYATASSARIIQKKSTPKVALGFWFFFIFLFSFLSPFFNIFIHFRTNFTGCFTADVAKVLDDFYGTNSSSDKLYTIVHYTRIFEMVGYSISFVSIVVSLCILSAFR